MTIRDKVAEAIREAGDTPVATRQEASEALADAALRVVAEELTKNTDFPRWICQSLNAQKSDINLHCIRKALTAIANKLKGE